MRPATRNGSDNAGVACPPKHRGHPMSFSALRDIRSTRDGMMEADAVAGSASDEMPYETTPPKRPQTSVGGSIYGGGFGLRSPVDHARQMRRVSSHIMSLVDPVERRKRREVEDMEALERYRITSLRYQTAAALDRLEINEDTERDVIRFSEKSAWRRLTTLLANDLRAVAVSTVFTLSAAPSADLTSDQSLVASESTTVARRRRRTIGAATLSDAQKLFLAQLDAIETGQAALRSSYTELEEATRYILSEHLFYDGYYEHRLHPFSNVPRVHPDERERRDRCMVELHEYRERREYAAQWLHQFRVMCFVLSPFIASTTLGMQWKALAHQFFTEHFAFLDGPWRCEERYHRHLIEASFEEDTRRLFQRVLAYIILEEPCRRRQIQAAGRTHRAVLTAHHNPRIQAIHIEHCKWLMRRCFRKLVGLRAYRDAAASQRHQVQTMANRCLVELRHRYMRRWRWWQLRKRQVSTVAVKEVAAKQELGSRYLRKWAGLASRHERLQTATMKLNRRHASHTKSRLVSCFHIWRRFALDRRAVACSRVNKMRWLQRLATRWYWGAWLLRRRKLHRTKFFKLEKMGELWRIKRVMSDWGPSGFLALQRRKREKHDALDVLLLGVRRHHMECRWSTWRHFMKRQKQRRASYKLLLLQNKAHLVLRMHTWLALVTMRDSVRKVNALLTHFTPQWLAPWYQRWNLIRFRKKEAISIALEQRTVCRRIAGFVERWQRYTKRHRYHRMLHQEGQLDLMQGRNAFRYAIKRLRDWIAMFLLRRQCCHVVKMENQSIALHVSSVIGRWRSFVKRQPQQRACEARGGSLRRALLLRYYMKLRRWPAASQSRRDKSMVALSLLRQSTKRFVRTAIRRWNARSCAHGRLLLIIDRNQRALMQRYLQLWRAFLPDRVNQRVALNLESLTAHRWRLAMFGLWRQEAHCRRLSSDVLEMERRNVEHCRGTLCRPIFNYLRRHVTTQRGLARIRHVAHNQLMNRYLQQWAVFSRNWRILATVDSMRRSAVRAVCGRHWAAWRAKVSQSKVRLVRHLLYKEPDASKSKVERRLLETPASPANGACRRYFVKWMQWLARRVHLHVSYTTLAMLHAFWMRRVYYRRWEHATKQTRQMSASPIEETSNIHTSLIHAGDVTLTNRRQFLRSLQAAQKRTSSPKSLSALLH